METQDFFNQMMEGAILYLREKGYISIPSATENPEPDYKAMVQHLKEQGRI